jgi:TrmH family RNA methyltransferase
MNGLSQNKAKQRRALQQKKAREESGLFLVEGGKTVLETLDASWPCESLVCTEKFLSEHKNILDSLQTEVFLCGEPQLNQLGTFKTNNTALLVARQSPPEKQPGDSQKLWLALEDISDPGNLGTIIRLADWFGLKEVICLGNCVEWFNPKVVAATMGSFLRIKEVIMTREEFVGKGRPWFAADMNGKNLYDFRFPGKSTILIGNEARGLDPFWLQKPESILSIPAFGKAESLNAAMATGIFLNHWRSGLHKPG